MKKLLLISALLLVASNGWAYTFVDFSNCKDTRKIDNHGYREIQKISNLTGELNYSHTCREGRYLTFSSDEVFECKGEIPVSVGERIVLLSSILEGIFLNPKKYENGRIPCASKPETQMSLFTSLLTLFEQNEDNFKRPLSFMGSEDYRESYMLVKEDNDQTYHLSKTLPNGVPYEVENFYYEDSDGRVVIYSQDALKNCTLVYGGLCQMEPELIILEKNDTEAIRIKKLFRWD